MALYKESQSLVLNPVLLQHEGGKAQALELAHSVESLAELRRLAGMVPLLVAVRGRVASYAPKRCELGGKDSVVHEIVEEEIYRKERENGRVTQEAFEVRRVFTQCEWFLEDSSGSKVRVENSNQADRIRSCLDTKQTFVPEEPTKTSLANLILEKALRSMHKYGVRKTEKFLPVGREVTVVGELTRSHTAPTRSDDSHGAGGGGGSGRAPGGGAVPGAHYASPSARDSAPAPSAPPLPAMEAGWSFIPFVVRKPTAGPFYITPLTLSQLRSSLSSRARTIKYVSLGFGALGAFLVIRKAVNQALDMHRRHTMRLRIAAAEKIHRAAMAARRAATGQASPQPAVRGSGGSGSSDSGTSGAQSRAGGARGAGEEGDASTGACVVCLELPSEMVFTACGHMCCCHACGQEVDRCPMCRTHGPSIKVFRS
ncbi:MAG: hypothetical protein WDW36_006079 [Sanguina aurantia]